MKKRLFISVLLVLLPALLPAQDDAETARRYAVEVIIFAYKVADSVGTEIFVPDLLDDAASALEFGDAAALPATPAATDPSGDLHYRVLDPEEFALTDTWGMLSRLQAYQPLMHFGWEQDAISEAAARPLALERFGNPPPGLAGSVSLALSRYLHLGMDLSLAADESYLPPSAPVPDDLSYESAGAAAGLEPGRRYAPLRYEIRETRIMKSGETRYYDHPHFGVIARVTRADESGEPVGRR